MSLRKQLEQRESAAHAAGLSYPVLCQISNTNTHIAEYLRSLAPALSQHWHVYPRVVGFNTEPHKALEIQRAEKHWETYSADIKNGLINDMKAAASITSALPDIKSSGTVIVCSQPMKQWNDSSIGQFHKKDEQGNLLPLRPEHVFVIFISSRAFRIFDPDWHPSPPGAKPVRITQLTNLGRARELYSRIRQDRSKRWRYRSGMTVGGGGNVEDGEEGDAFCLFLCWELLERIRGDPQMDLKGLLYERITR